MRHAPGFQSGLVLHFLQSFQSDAFNLIQFVEHNALRQTKLPSNEGTGGDSRGTTQIGQSAHSSPTIIGYPFNAGTAAQTTERDT